MKDDENARTSTSIWTDKYIQDTNDLLHVYGKYLGEKRSWSKTKGTDT